MTLPFVRRLRAHPIRLGARDVVPAHVARRHHADRAGEARAGEPFLEQGDGIDADRQVRVADLEPRDEVAGGEAGAVERPAEDPLPRGEARDEEGLGAGRLEERFHLLGGSNGSARDRTQAPRRGRAPIRA
jgi:hypothetical protein